ncbi:MAG: type VI secretion system tube protein Hcp [Paracoccaceae bacterium]
MTDQKKADVLADDDLDQATGGLSYTMDGVMISSYSTSGASSALPAEDFKMNYEEIKVTYASKK